MIDEKTKLALQTQCYIDPVAFCRIVLPDWFPTKMPWLHRGLLALWSGKCEFLLNFSEENWRDEKSSWTVEDLQTLIREFVFKVDPTDPESETFEAFSLSLDENENLQIAMVTSDRLLAMIPRGFSKTTLANAYNVWQIVYKVSEFIVYISESAAHAERQVSSIRTQLETNDILIELFGALKPERTAPQKWTDGYIEPTNGVKIGAIGRGGQIRGMAKDAQRPDTIICDDIEDTDSVRNPELLTETRRWAKGTVEPALKKFGADRGKLIYIGTLLKSDALLPTLATDPEYFSVLFGAVDSRGDPVWPAKMSLADLEKTKKSFMLLGVLEDFYLEYMTSVRHNTDKLFPSDKFVYASYAQNDFVAVAYAHDPAISEKRTADMAAHAVVAITRSGSYHVLAAEGKVGLSEDKKIARLFELYDQFLLPMPMNARRVGIEAIAYQRSLITTVEQERNKKAQILLALKSAQAKTDINNIDGYSEYAFEVTPITHGQTSKAIRIKGILRPLLMSGRLTFARKFVDFEQQLDTFPSGKDDIPDAVAMAIHLLKDFAGIEGIENTETTNVVPFTNWRNAP